MSVGQRLSMGTIGKYEVIRKIAAGGMAELFLARYWSDGGYSKDVVVKRLFRHMAEDPSLVEMFQLEAKLMAELCHPGVPQVYEVGRDDGTWFMAMEFIDGHSLADLWRAGARMNMPMPMPVAVGIVLQVCEALHHTHGRRDRAGRALGIVHRDVTPQNIMVTRDGVAKVIDFGVAFTRARPEAGTSPKGTYAYMSPEQIRVRDLDGRSDVFSVGVLLFELTTGTRLFEGTEVEVMTSIVEREAPNPNERHDEYPDALSKIVGRALKRDRAERFASAAGLAAELERFCMAAGWPVGLRATAAYVSRVFPYAVVPDESVALVPEERTGAEGTAGPEDSGDAGADPAEDLDWPTPTVFDFAFIRGDDNDV